MTHQMKLNPWAFEQISNGSKTYEIRLYDEKRREIKAEDKIVFSELLSLDTKLEVTVVKLIKAKDFEKLFTMFDPILVGWKEEDSPTKCAEDMSKYYSKEDEQRYGVVALEVELNK